MAVFMLETDALTSASSAISSLASQVNEVSNSINGYDTSCEDGFDFAGAKSVLASNVEACSTKITNTASILENVVSAHTELQSSMKFDGSGNTSDSSSSSSSGATSSGSVSSGSSSSGSYSGGGYSGGGSYSGGSSSYGGGDYSGGYSGAAVSGRTVSDLVTEKVKDSNTDNAKKVTGSDSLKDKKDTEKQENEKEKSTDSKSTDSSEEKVKTELKNVNYAYINSDKVTDKSKEIFNDATFNYDTNTGYATVDGKYVIACDSSVGEVGDIIKFSQKDGSTVECVVGTNTVTDASKNVINFIVDKENWANKTPMSISENLINNTTTITNAGQYNVKPNRTITTLVNEISTMDTNTAGKVVPAETKEV